MTSFLNAPYVTRVKSNFDFLQDSDCNEANHACVGVPTAAPTAAITAVVAGHQNARYKKCSVISNDSQFDNAENKTGMTEIYNNGKYLYTCDRNIQ